MTWHKKDNSALFKHKQLTEYYLQEPYLFVEQRGSTYYVNTNVGLQVSVICFLLQGFL